MSIHSAVGFLFGTKAESQIETMERQLSGFDRLRICVSRGRECCVRLDTGAPGAETECV